MSDEVLRISGVPQTDGEYASLDYALVVGVTQAVQQAGGEVYLHVPPLDARAGSYELNHAALTPAEILVALGSAGMFTALYQIIASYLTRNKGRELTISRGKTSLTLKGHSLPEEKALLEALAPELLGKRRRAKKKD